MALLLCSASLALFSLTVLLSLFFFSKLCGISNTDQIQWRHSISIPAPSASAESKWLIRHNLGFGVFFSREPAEKTLTAWLAACSALGIYCHMGKLHLKYRYLVLPRRSLSTPEKASLDMGGVSKHNSFDFHWTKSKTVTLLWNWWICFRGCARRNHRYMSLVDLPHFHPFVFARTLDKTCWILLTDCFLEDALTQYVQSLSVKLLTKNFVSKNLGTVLLYN